MPNVVGQSIPSHMAVGRGNAAGPIIGGYLMFQAGPVTVTGGATKVLAWAMPCDFRIERIGWNMRSINTGTTGTMELYKNATPVVAAGTPLTTSATTFDLDVNLTSWVAPLPATPLETVGTTGLSLSAVAGVRDVAQGQYIVCNLAPQAAHDLSDFNIYVLGVMMSHVTADSAND